MTDDRRNAMPYQYPAPWPIGARVRLIERRDDDSGRTGTVRLSRQHAASVEMDDTGEHQPWANFELEEIPDEPASPTR